MSHRDYFKAYLRLQNVSGNCVDWGAGTKPAKRYYDDKAKFYNIDKEDYLWIDLVADIEQPIKLKEYNDFAFCLEVLEHVWNADQLIKNIYNNIKPGGTLYLTQPFMFEVHKEDDRKRYTHHGLRLLLEENGFKVINIISTGGDLDHAEGYIVKAMR